MLRNKRFRLRPGWPKLFFSPVAGFGLAIVALGLLGSRPAAAETRLVPQGTAQENVTVLVPESSPLGQQEPVVVTADYQAREDLPPGLTYPPGAVGRALTFGVWQGEAVSLQRFDPSIVINVKYQDSDAELAGVAEDKLVLMMYNPAANAWVKLCSSVDIYLNTVSAALALATPFEQGTSTLRGSSLLVIASDSTLPLNQSVDSQGITTIGLTGSDLYLQVPAGAVESGANFELTPLPNLPGSLPLRLLARPIDIKLCLMDYDNPAQNSRQLNQLAMPLKVGFRYDLATASRAGGQANLTMVDLQGNRWLDLEALGLRIVRSGDRLVVDTRRIGTFSLAAR